MTMVLAAVLSLWVGGAAEAYWCGGPGSTGEAQHSVGEHACYELYFNGSGAAQTSGTVVVLSAATATGVNEGITGSLNTVPDNAGRNDIDVDGTDGDVTNVGTYITTTTTADNELVVGVIDDNSCADATYCRVQIYGPRLTLCAGGTNATTVNTAVGTSTVVGQCGDAANDADGTLGVALTATDTSADFEVAWVFIRPSWTD